MSADELDLTVDQAVRALVRAAQRLDSSPSSFTAGVVDPESAVEMISAVERLVSGLPADSTQQDIALSLRAARAEILTAQVARQRSMLNMVTRQTARLRAARTVDELVEAIPSETSKLGYERVMFSWVANDRWIPQSSHTVSGPHESQAMLAAGGPPYCSVRELNEVVVVRRRQPILVLDAASNPRVHPTIIPVSKSVTYVAAPVVARDRVAGIVHLDRNLESGLNDEFDRDLLGLFCQNIGVTLERLLDSVKTTEAQAPPGSHEDWFDGLTEREREVLALVASGLTNAQIGARLYVSEETTKTHVKKLMRKMGVANRSQAGAMYHRLDRRSAP